MEATLTTKEEWKKEQDKILKLRWRLIQVISVVKVDLKIMELKII